MTIIDSIVKSRDITWPTKVHLVKDMAFSVVMHRCESWTIKKLSAEELMLLNCGIGEGNGNPLPCSCLGYPRDGGAWWAAVYGVTQSRTRLKRLSSIM